MCHADEWWTMCDSCIAYQFKEFDGSKVDYVSTIEKILEADFKSLVLKVKWFHNMPWLEDCQFCSIDTSKLFGGRPHEWPTFCISIWGWTIFFVNNQFNPKRSLVLQNNPKCNTIFDKFLKAPRALTNGTKVVGFLASD